MKTTSDYLDALAVETLSDMADSFFSRRKGLEDAIEAFNAQAEEVKAKAETVLPVWRAMHRLLLTEDGVREFLRLAGLPETGPLAFVEEGKPVWRLDPPFAFTAKGRYQGGVLACYGELTARAREYREGVYAPDPRNPKRKRLTPNYDSLAALAGKLCGEIDDVNNNQPAYCVVNFAKSLNPAEIERERITGATLGDMEATMNTDLAFDRISFDDLGVPDIPVPPELETVKKALSELASKLFRNQPDRAAAALASLAPA